MGHSAASSLLPPLLLLAVAAPLLSAPTSTKHLPPPFVRARFGPAGVPPLPRVSVVAGVASPGATGKGEGGNSSRLARFQAAGRGVLLPRGADYIRLNRTSIGTGPQGPASTSTPSETPAPAYHSTFSVGKYNRSEADTALARMAALGMNMTRIFIDDGRTYCGIADAAPHVDATMAGAKATTTSGGGGNTAASGVGLVPVLPCTEATARSNGVNGEWDSLTLNAAYMDNFADFALLAVRHGVWLMPTLQRFPCNARYAALTQPRNSVDISDGNADYLERGTVHAKAVYLSEFAAALQARVGVALMSTVLA